MVVAKQTDGQIFLFPYIVRRGEYLTVFFCGEPAAGRNVSRRSQQPVF